jgi:AbrB family looped-hinge helix DNA binding protein
VADLPFEWYVIAMETAIDKAGRVVIPAPLRARYGLTPGTKLDLVGDDVSLRLIRHVEGPALVRSGKRVVARPRTKVKAGRRIDPAQLVEEERNRWPW